MISPRIAIVALVLMGGIFTMRIVKPKGGVRLRQALSEFPSAIDDWRSEDLPFDAQVVQEIGADDYVNREYFGGARPVELYIGYYKDQRSGDAIHSPKNCLPGDGWVPLHSTRLQIGRAGEPVLVNEVLVKKGATRAMVLYWYQSHGHIVASEYGAKFWLVADGLGHRGTEGAMIRVWTNAADGELSARTRAANFARRIYPEVAEFLPN